MDKETIKAIFAQKTERRDTTNTAYTNRLLALKKGYEIYRKRKCEEEEKEWEGCYENWDFLHNVDDVIHYITKVPNQRKSKDGEHTLPTDATKIGNLNPIIEFLHLTNEFIIKEQYQDVKKVIDDRIQKKYEKSNGLTEKQNDNIIEYQELLDYYDKLKEECKIYEEKPLKSHLDEWEIINLNSMCLLMKLMLCHPSRNEYASLRFIPLVEYKKIKKPELNYVVLGQKKCYLSISNSKTSDVNNVKVTEIINKDLIKSLKKWKTSLGDEDRLFIAPKTNKQWSNDQLCQMMTKYSSRLINKSIGSTIMYKIIIKELGKHYNEAMDDENFTEAIKCNKILETYAKTRGHSQNIQKKIYIVKD